MPNISKKENLINLSYMLSEILAADSVGEEYHSLYRKNKNVFRKIVKTDENLEKAFKKYFKELSQDRAPKQIDWKIYNKELLKGSPTDAIKIDWVAEKLLVRIFLDKFLKDALVAGGELTEEEFGIDIGWSSSQLPAINFLQSYSVKLAGQLTKTTQKLITKSIRTSIEMQENRAGAEARIREYIDDPKRASMIAQTESVRAFSEGRLEVARQIGATKKSWLKTIGACPICRSIDSDKIGLEEDFTDDFGGSYQSPPAHPRCRCIVKIYMDNEV